MKNSKLQRLGTAVLALAAVSCPKALAQDAISFLNEANTQIRTAGTILYQVVMGVLCLIAIVSLITVALKMHSGDRDGANKALGWCGGMVFCIIMALVIKNFMGV